MREPSGSWHSGVANMTEQRFERMVSFGSALVDIMAFVPALPEPGGDVLATEALEVIGGVFNIESAAAGWACRSCTPTPSATDRTRKR